MRGTEDGAGRATTRRRDGDRDPRRRPGREPVVLVDCAAPPGVDACAWVEVWDAAVDSCRFAGTRMPDRAAELVAAAFPVDVRGDDVAFACDGEQVWMRREAGPAGQAPSPGGAWPGGPWVPAEGPEAADALKFWVVRAVPAPRGALEAAPLRADPVTRAHRAAVQYA